MLKKATVILSSGNDDDDNVIGMMESTRNERDVDEEKYTKNEMDLVSQNNSEVECKFENLNIRFDCYVSRESITVKSGLT